MRKLIFTLVITLAGISLTAPTFIPTARSAPDCQKLSWECAESSAQIYNACVDRCGGVTGCIRMCDTQGHDWWLQCMAAGGCPVNN